MSKNQSVAIKINQDRLLSNLEFSFSNKSTVLGEMMQNARRAGATQVDFSYKVKADVGVLNVVDNGSGIDDFQNLFSVAESGWSEEIKTKEHAFGMGWLSCLYGAESIRVESNGKFIEGTTQAILSGAAIDVQSLSDTASFTKSYTKITLYNFGMTEKEMSSKLAHLSSGFAIDCTFNGEMQNRFCAKANLRPDLRVESAPVGEIYLAGSSNHGNGSKTLILTKTTAVFLQGLPVYANDWIRDETATRINVVHLDQELHFARMPDRDKLINEVEVLDLIKKEVNKAHLARLIEFKNTLTPEEFAHYDFMKYASSIEGGLKVLSDSSTHVSSYFYGEVHAEQPTMYSEVSLAANPLYDVSKLNLQKSYSLQDVQDGKINFCVIEAMEDWVLEDTGMTNAVSFVFARQIGWPVIHQSIEFFCGPEAKHWLKDYVHELDAVNNDNFQVEIVNEEKRKSYGFAYWPVSVSVVLCESYNIAYTDRNGKIHTVNVSDEPLLIKDNILLVPSNCKSGDAASMSVHQGYGYEWEDDYHEDKRIEDENEFAFFLNLMRTGDEAKALQELINTADFSQYKELAGKEFKLMLDEHGKVNITAM